MKRSGIVVIRFLRKDAFEDVKFPELSRAVKYFKETEGGFGEMCKTVEDYAKNYAKDYAEEREKIGLEKGLASKGSYYNNVNRNILILNESDMPDKENGNVILAGHSGSGRTAFFKNLYNGCAFSPFTSIFWNILNVTP